LPWRASAAEPEADGPAETQPTANETLVYDAGTFSAWLQAYSAGAEKLQNLLARRFTPEYRMAFDA